MVGKSGDKIGAAYKMDGLRQISSLGLTTSLLVFATSVLMDNGSKYPYTSRTAPYTLPLLPWCKVLLPNVQFEIFSRV